MTPTPDLQRLVSDGQIRFMTALTHDPTAQTLTLKFHTPAPMRMTYGTLQFADVQDYVWYPSPLPGTAALPAPPHSGSVTYISETPMPNGTYYLIFFFEGQIGFRTSQPPAWSESISFFD